MVIECEYAVHYKEAGRIVFERNVYYVDSLRHLWADKVIYYIDSDSLEAIGKVKIMQTDYEGHCYHAYYSHNREDLTMHRDVILQEQKRNITLTGYKGFGDKTLEYARVFGQAQLVKKDSLDKTELTIDAEKIEYFNQESRAQALDSVVILREDITGNCGELQYFMQDKRALLTINPVVMREQDELKGDSIYLYFKEEKIDHIEIFGNASALSPAEGGSPGDFNKMYGQQMLVEVENDKISDITVTVNARSLYYLFENQEFKGINKASGDKIFLHFSEGKIETIQVAGGTEGTYFPPDYKGIIE
jgi:lipopolysaccharide export system protein LptA